MRGALVEIVAVVDQERRKQRNYQNGA
jgi:hypothetical protein